MFVNDEKIEMKVSKKEHIELEEISYLFTFQFYMLILISAIYMTINFDYLH